MTAAEHDLLPDTPPEVALSARERIKVAQDVAAGLAHEIRNPVFAIASAARLLRYRVVDDPVVEHNVGRILREAERLNSLVTELVDYARPAPIHRAPGDPDELWTDVLQLQRGALEAKALIVHHTPASPRATCSVDAEQLAQVYTQLLDNAIDAANEGSDLTLISTATVDGGWRSELHNAGPPIADDLLPRVFDLLVSAKPGRAGIGLALARRIIVEHGGTISLDNASRSDGGVTATITLPAASARIS